MAARGQRFTLDPDADNFTFNIDDEGSKEHNLGTSAFIKEIKERDPSGPPPPPKPKQTKAGFPQHRPRRHVSAVKQWQPQANAENPPIRSPFSSQVEPSDRAIAHHVGRKYGYNPEAKEKADISEENRRRIAQMSTEDIEQARAELMSSLNPAFMERLLRRANLDEDKDDHDWESPDQAYTSRETTGQGSAASKSKVAFSPDLNEQQTVPMAAKDSSHDPPNSVNNIEPQFQEVQSSIHFPRPPRNPDDYVSLDPDAPSFLSDLKRHYFPSMPDDPSTLSWLQDPTPEEIEASPYAPTQTRYAPSDIRFDFHGRLIAPSDSRDIPVDKGLHHHGKAPESAGYTIPELTILARSSLPNQRCMAYQVLGRMLYRLGRGDFGPRGSELQEGLWACVEKERSIEIMMSEANRTVGHVSAKSYATEALWLWRKGGGGERGVSKPGETFAK